jgi:outer membrane protein
MKNALILITSLFISMAAFGQKAQKFAYVNPGYLYVNHPEYVALENSIAKEKRELDSLLTLKVQDFQNKIQAFIKDSTTMSEVLKLEKKKAFQGTDKDIADFKQAAEKGITKKAEDGMAKINKTLQDAIDAVAKEIGATYVLKSETLAVAPESDNISDRVLKKLGITPKK